jgi:hypothetical protein
MSSFLEIARAVAHGVGIFAMIRVGSVAVRRTVSSGDGGYMGRRVGIGASPACSN